MTNRLMDNVRRFSAVTVALVVILSLIPVVYCGWFNYASADDFAKSYEVHDVLVAGGSLWRALCTGVLAAKEVWEVWEGTWASNFVLAMQPSIWGEHAYAVTVPLCILYTAIGTGYLLREILVHQLGMSVRSYWILFWAQLFLFLQYMPYIRGGVFWYTGMAHYIMPMCFALLMIAWMLKWLRTGQKRYWIFMLIDAIYIGGSHYQQIILVLLALLSGWLWMLVRAATERQSINKRIHLMWLPMIVTIIGLVICVLSPGNAIRGGEGFGFSAASVALMPASCVVEACRHIQEYAVHSPLLAAYAVLLWGIGWRLDAGNTHASETFRRIPGILVVLYLFLMYASTEAAAIYATGNTNGISGGYYDIVYQSLLLVMTIGIPFAAMRVRLWIERRRTAVLQGSVLRIGWGACVVLLILISMKSAVKGSAAWTCYTFASSGRLEDFVIQMEERIELLNDPSLVDIYVPEMNDDQGPFMHLQLSQDSTNYTNESTALYYHKNTVTAVPREVYYQEYAAQQGHEIPEKYRR